MKQENENCWSLSDDQIESIIQNTLRKCREEKQQPKPKREYAYIGISPQQKAQLVNKIVIANDDNNLWEATNEYRKRLKMEFINENPLIKVPVELLINGKLKHSLTRNEKRDFNSSVAYFMRERGFKTGRNGYYLPFRDYDPKAFNRFSFGSGRKFVDENTFKSTLSN